MDRQSLECPNCHKTLKTKQPIASGKRIKCPACTRTFVVGETKADPVEEQEEHPATAASRSGEPPDVDESLARTIRWAGIGMLFTGGFWAAVPTILILVALVAIPGLHCFVVGFGLLLVLFSAPLLLSGFCLYRHRPRWYVLPGCFIAIAGGLITVGWVLVSMETLMNEFKGFPPPDLAGRVGLAMTFAVIVIGPLSVLSGLGGTVAVVRASRGNE